MIRFYWLAVCLLAIADCVAQQDEIPPVVSVLRINILNPGLAYEAPIAPKQSIMLAGGFNTSFGIGISSAVGTRAFISFDPALSFQYRYYYNGRKRNEQGRQTARNSMNYLAPLYSVIFSAHQIDPDAYEAEPAMRPVHTFGAIWGLQRNYKSRFSLDLDLGVGYLIGKSTYYESNDQVAIRLTGKPTALVNLQLGIWINKRKE